MFIPHHSLGHQERELFAPRKFMESITLSLWIFTISFIINFKKADKILYLRRKVTFFWVAVDRSNNHYDSNYYHELIEKLIWVLEVLCDRF